MKRTHRNSPPHHRSIRHRDQDAVAKRRLPEFGPQGHRQTDAHLFTIGSRNLTQKVQQALIGLERCEEASNPLGIGKFRLIEKRQAGGDHQVFHNGCIGNLTSTQPERPGLSHQTVRLAPEFWTNLAPEEAARLVAVTCVEHFGRFRAAGVLSHGAA